MFIMCGAKGSGDSDPFNIKPKAQAKEGKSLRMNKEGLKLLGGIAKDHPVLGEPGSWKEKAAHPQRQPSQSSQTKGPTKGDSYGSMVEKQL